MKPQGHIDEFTQFIVELRQHDVRFVVCGGIACIIHGVQRTTADLDIVVELTHDNLARLIDVARSRALQPRVPEPLEALLDEARRKDWIENKNAKVYTLVSPQSPLQVDVMLVYPIGFDDLWAEARIEVMRGVEFRVSSKRHLIAAKDSVDPPRVRDRRDIEDLQELIRREQSHE